MALAMHVSAGRALLNWRGRRTARVLYIDGEMARRLYRERIRDAVSRLGERPADFHALSREDMEDFPPLNTAEGQGRIEAIIAAIDGVDLIVFDSIMCLLAGDMKDGEGWAQVMPWVRSLTKRNIGQVWIHHTGHDAGRSYGDKTKEWQLDTVLHMNGVENALTDVSFTLEFKKARERTPTTKGDFRISTVALIGDEWTTDGAKPDRKGSASPLGVKFLDALNNVLAGDEVAVAFGHRATTMDAWRAECQRLGLIDDAKPDSARTLFAKHRRELIASNLIACNGQTVWTL
jgi:hypothetical protein